MFRYTILKIGKLHIRYHRVFGKDETELFHNHPFNYITVILSGGYTDVVMDEEGFTTKRILGLFSIMKRSHSVYHRLEDIKPNTRTLFFTYGEYTWDAFLPNCKETNLVMVKTPTGWYKKYKGVNFIEHEDYTKAMEEQRHSIHQFKGEVI